MPVNEKRSVTIDRSGARRLLSPPHGDNFVPSMCLVFKGYRPGRWLSIGQAADLAGVSVRTLQRRLATEGLVYSEMVDEVRADLATELLNDPNVTPREAANALGYSTTSNFARAFRRWHGVTPAEYRKAQKTLA